MILTVDFPKQLFIPSGENEALLGFIDSILRPIADNVKEHCTVVEVDVSDNYPLTREFDYSNVTKALQPVMNRIMAMAPSPGESEIHIEQDDPGLYALIGDIVHRNPIFIETNLGYLELEPSEIVLQNNVSPQGASGLHIRFKDTEQNISFIYPLETLWWQSTVADGFETHSSRQRPLDIETSDNTGLFLLSTDRCGDDVLFSELLTWQFYRNCSLEPIDSIKALYAMWHYYKPGFDQDQEPEFDFVFTDDNDQVILGLFAGFYGSAISASLTGCPDEGESVVCDKFTLTKKQAREQYPDYFDPEPVGLEATKRNSIRVF